VDVEIELDPIFVHALAHTHPHARPEINSIMIRSMSKRSAGQSACDK
jgi:hypothetical protein